MRNSVVHVLREAHFTLERVQPGIAPARRSTASEMTRVLRLTKVRENILSLGRFPRGATRDETSSELLPIAVIQKTAKFCYNCLSTGSLGYNVQLSWCLLHGSLKAKFTGALLHFRFRCSSQTRKWTFHLRRITCSSDAVAAIFLGKFV